MFIRALLLASLIPVTALAIDYRPLVELPIVGSGVQTISGYLVSIFQLLIGVAGILAVVRMVLCGFQAIISVNPSAREEASQCVLGAVTGLLLALSAWLILYQINPVLISGEFTPPTTGTVAGGGGTPPTGGTPAQCDARNLCERGESGPSCSNANRACDSYAGAVTAAANRSGVSANLIREIMAQESSCNISAGSGAGACGLMQLLPSTANQHKRACGIPSYTSITCNWLRDPANAGPSICLAAQELAALQRGACGTNQRQVIAGYNGGPGACYPSASCSTELGCDGQSMSRWECSYDDQAHQKCNTGFQETRTYVRRLLNCLP